MYNFDGDFSIKLFIKLFDNQIIDINLSIRCLNTNILILRIDARLLIIRIDANILII